MGKPNYVRLQLAADLVNDVFLIFGVRLKHFWINEFWNLQIQRHCLYNIKFKQWLRSCCSSTLLMLFNLCYLISLRPFPCSQIGKQETWLWFSTLKGPFHDFLFSIYNNCKGSSRVCNRFGGLHLFLMLRKPCSFFVYLGVFSVTIV